MLTNAKAYSLALLATALLAQTAPLPQPLAAAAAPMLAEMAPSLIGGVLGGGGGGGGGGGITTPMDVLGNVVKPQPQSNSHEVTDNRQHAVQQGSSHKKDYDFSGNNISKLTGNKPKPWENQEPSRYQNRPGRRDSYDDDGDDDDLLLRRELFSRSPKGSAGHGGGANRGAGGGGSSKPTGGATGGSPASKPKKEKPPPVTPEAMAAAADAHTLKKEQKASNKGMYAMQAAGMAGGMAPYMMQGGMGAGSAAQGGYAADPAAAGGYATDPAAAGGYATDPAATGGYTDPSSGAAYPAAAPAASAPGTPTGQSNSAKHTDNSVQQVDNKLNTDSTMKFRRWIAKRAEPAPTPSPAPAPAPAAASKPATPTTTPAANKPASASLAFNSAVFTKPASQSKSSSSAQPTKTQTPKIQIDQSQHQDTKIGTVLSTQTNNTHIDQSTKDSHDKTINAQGAEIHGDLDGNSVDCGEAQVSPAQFCLERMSGKDAGEYKDVCGPVINKFKTDGKAGKKQHTDEKNGQGKKKQNGGGGQQQRRQVVLSSDVALEARGRSGDTQCICYCPVYNFKRGTMLVNQQSISPNYRRSLSSEKRAFVAPKGCTIKREGGRAVYGGKLCPIAGKKAVKS